MTREQLLYRALIDERAEVIYSKNIYRSVDMTMDQCVVMARKEISSEFPKRKKGKK